MKSSASVDSYLRAVDADVRGVLTELRALVKKTAPEANERIAYGMPAYGWHGKTLFYFAAMKGHLGLYPTPEPIRACAALLTAYSTSKGCVRIPYDATLPKTLIAKLIRERMREIRRDSA